MKAVIFEDQDNYSIQDKYEREGAVEDEQEGRSSNLCVRWCGFALTNRSGKKEVMNPKDV